MKIKDFFWKWGEVQRQKGFSVCRKLPWMEKWRRVLHRQCYFFFFAVFFSRMTNLLLFTMACLLFDRLTRGGYWEEMGVTCEPKSRWKGVVEHVGLSVGLQWAFPTTENIASVVKATKLLTRQYHALVEAIKKSVTQLDEAVRIAKHKAIQRPYNYISMQYLLKQLIDLSIIVTTVLLLLLCLDVF